MLAFHPDMLSSLFSAIMNGVLFAFRICNTSAVCGFIPSFMSMTRIAMSASEPPRFRRFVNAAWPGVSMKSSPGISNGILNCFNISPARFWMLSFGRVVNEIFCVIPPASPSWTFVCRMLSSMDVFPWST